MDMMVRSHWSRPALSLTTLPIAAVFVLTARGPAQTDWRDVSPNTPCAARVAPGAVYDAVRGCTVAFGGYAWSFTQTYDGGRWFTPSLAVEPPIRVRHAMAFDLARGRTVLFGGMNSPFFDDTWEWDGTAWQQRSVTGPSARIESVMAHDILRGRTVLFGGWTTSGGANDTWEWDGTSWTQRQPLHRPPPHATSSLYPSATMSYDVNRGRCVLVRFTLPNPGLADVWEWDGNDWLHPTPPSSPPYRANPAQAFDLSMGRTVLFGGRPYPFTQQPYDEMWAWDGSTWQLITPVAGPTPGRREAAGLVYDATRARLVLFGGQDAGVLLDTWEWDGSTWIPRSSNLPTQYKELTATFDSARNAGVMFGGLDAAARSTDDTWEWRAGDWHATSPLHRPPARCKTRLAYDAARQRTVVFGGQSLFLGSPAVELGDTWEWDGIDWTQRNPANAPSARYDAAMTFDSVHQQIVLFG